MKRKSYLIIALLLAAVVSSGSYAYTFSQASVMLNVTAAGGDMATAEEVADQPDWDSILAGESGVEILRPSAAGDVTNINLQEPGTEEHWDKVDEELPDGDSSYVYTSGYDWEEDLYQMADHAIGSGNIIYVKVYMVTRSLGTPTQSSAYIHIKTNGAEHNGTDETVITDYALYSYQWDTNPQTGEAWTWNEIDALQIGLGLRQARGAGGNVLDRYTLTTQIYAEIAWNTMPLHGEVPAGDLFEITPHADYTGDLGVTVYLTNIEELTKAYQYLNVKVYMENSAEASQTPNYQLLTLDNGTVTFILESGVSDNFTMSTVGGGYGLNSSDSLAWEEGWSVTPELYCEVTQKRRS